ncbi:MAG: hypothetical protein SFY70_10575 [Bacteroidia bacterium]|nr:hypothetical protein [Bacteroidia bacterium]
MKPVLSVLVVLAALVISTDALAQSHPRKEDVLWKKRLVRRIDLNEKINLPIARGTLADFSTGKYYTDDTGSNNPNDPYGINALGMIVALYWNYEKGVITGYRPDSLAAVRPFSLFQADYNRFNKGQLDAAPATTTGGGGDDLFGGDEFGDDFGGDFGDDFGSDFGDFDDGSGAAAAPAPTDTTGGGTAPAAPTSNPIVDKAQGLMNYCYLIEDRGFDKVRSETYHDILYIVLAYPNVTGGEIDIATGVAFKYSEVLPLLDKVQYKNRFNDSQHRSVKEAFDLRMFNSVIVAYGSEAVSDLLQAEEREQQMLTYEHHLWSF